jgi:hypothetical protein
MPRRKGLVNYKNNLLINIMADVLPNGGYGWQTVALAYQEQSKEEILRDSADMKKHWIRTLCNGMKKPTGRTGEDGNRIHRCISIEKKILNKTHSGMLGFSSSDDEATSDGRGNLEENALQASLFDRSSSTVGGEEDNAVNDSIESLESVEHDDVPAAVPDNPPHDPPVCERHSITSQGDSGNDGVDFVTPNVRANLKRAGDQMVSQKTKNSSNKNKERTSIAGAIVKMIERQDSGGMAASMSMMLMRQLDAMNSSLERREQQERRQERRERKKRKKKRKLRKKRRARKKAKKEARKATLADLDDHGGKAGLDSSSSSSSNSDSSSSDSNSSSHTSQSSNYGHGSWRRKGDIAKED